MIDIEIEIKGYDDFFRETLLSLCKDIFKNFKTISDNCSNNKYLIKPLGENETFDEASLNSSDIVYKFKKNKEPNFPVQDLINIVSILIDIKEKEEKRKDGKKKLHKANFTVIQEYNIFNTNEKKEKKEITVAYILSLYEKDKDKFSGLVNFIKLFASYLIDWELVGEIYKEKYTSKNNQENNQVKFPIDSILHIVVKKRNGLKKHKGYE